MLVAVNPTCSLCLIPCLTARALSHLREGLIGRALTPVTRYDAAPAFQRRELSGRPAPRRHARNGAHAGKESPRHVGPPVLQRVAAGEPGAVQECIDRYAGLVWSLARRMTSNNAEAEDAVQEILVEIWRNAYRYDPNIASEAAFIAMVTRRRLIDRRRRLDRQRDRSALPDDPSGAIGVPPTAELGEEARIAVSALEQLSPDQQKVLRLSIYQGLSHEKIATATGMPLGTVKTHARRGLIKVRELLTKWKGNSQEVNS